MVQQPVAQIEGKGEIVLNSKSLVPGFFGGTDHIQRFILELGQGFACMGKQYPLNVGGDDFYLDLLFYHTRLRCDVVIELKVDEFKPEYVGKLNFYLNAVNAQLRHPQDQRSIGILLCKTPNKVVAEYSLQEFASPLGVGSTGSRARCRWL